MQYKGAGVVSMGLGRYSSICIWPAGCIVKARGTIFLLFYFI